MPLVDIDHMSDPDDGDAGQVLVVILAAATGRPGRMPLVVAANADDRDVDRVVRALLRAATGRKRRSQPDVAAAVFDRNRRRCFIGLSPFHARRRSAETPVTSGRIVRDARREPQSGRR